MNFWNIVFKIESLRSNIMNGAKKQRILEKVTSAFLPFFISRNHLRIRFNHSRRPCLEQPTFAISVKEIISRMY